MCLLSCGFLCSAYEVWDLLLFEHASYIFLDISTRFDILLQGKKFKLVQRTHKPGVKV